MSKIFKRIGAILVALTLCLGTSATAFAAESEPVVSQTEVADTSATSEDEGIMPCSNYIGSNRIVSSDVGTFSIPISLSTAIWNTTFRVIIDGDSSVLYNVTITEPNGTRHSMEAWGNGTPYPITLFYTSAGTYMFSFNRVSSGSSTVLAIVEVYS